MIAAAIRSSASIDFVHLIIGLPFISLVSMSFYRMTMTMTNANIVPQTVLDFKGNLFVGLNRYHLMVHRQCN